MQLLFPKPKKRSKGSRRYYRAKKRKLSGRLRGRNIPRSDRDEAAKIRLGYEDPRSFVRWDGSEVLKGADWQKRIEELRERCAGQCENTLENGERCGSLPRDPHHIERRHPRRNDQLKNLLAVCGPCHRILDPRKVKWGSR